MSEAQQIADDLDAEFVAGRISNHTGRKAALELRRLEAVKSELMGTLKTTGLFLHHCWCDVSMNEYSFEKLNGTMRLVDETVKKHGGT